MTVVDKLIYSYESLLSCGHYFCTRCATKLYEKKICPDCSKRPQFMICFSL